MYSFGKRSKEALNTCHPDLQTVLHRVIQHMDFSVIEGLRTTEKQQEYYDNGKSQLDGINRLSWHQDRFGDGFSRAVDIVPFADGKQQWEDYGLYRRLAKLMFNEWQELLKLGRVNHRLEWGNHWTSFQDRPHWQIKPV